MTRCYLVVSDLHLSDVEDHADGWKAYKQRRFMPDEAFAALLRSFRARHAAVGTPTLVLNGDIIDFDLITAVPPDPPWPVRRREHRHGLEATAAKSAWKLEHVLAQHPRFVEALATFLVDGGRLIYVIGNHDRELCFPEVQRVLLDALAATARASGRPLPENVVRFEPWFFHEAGAIYAEHGQQFDSYTAFKHPLRPTVETREGAALALPMGNLSNRYLIPQMGFFNPHAADFILNFFRYIAHWVRYYLFSRRGLVLPWFIGSLLVLRRSLQLQRLLRSAPGGEDPALAEEAWRHGLAVETVQRLRALHRPPIEGQLYRMLREFWLDRLLLAGLLIGGTITLALVPIPLWIKLMVPLSSFPLLYLLYEWAAQGETIFTMAKHIPVCARAISEILPTPVVTFGHTHQPRLIPLRRGVCFVDTGTWAPITVGEPRSPQLRLAPGYRNYLEVVVDGEAAQVKFDAWMEAD